MLTRCKKWLILLVNEHSWQNYAIYIWLVMNYNIYNTKLLQHVNKLTYNILIFHKSWKALTQEWKIFTLEFKIYGWLQSIKTFSNPLVITIKMFLAYISQQITQSLPPSPTVHTFPARNQFCLAPLPPLFWYISTRYCRTNKSSRIVDSNLGLLNAMEGIFVSPVIKKLTFM